MPWGARTAPLMWAVSGGAEQREEVEEPQQCRPVERGTSKPLTCRLTAGCTAYDRHVLRRDEKPSLNRRTGMSDGLLGFFPIVLVNTVELETL